MADSDDYRGALEAVDRILNRGGSDEAVLQAVADVVRDRTGLEIGVSPGQDDEARAFLDRVALLVSAHAARVPPSG